MYAQAVGQQCLLVTIPPSVSSPPTVLPAAAEYKGCRATKATRLHFFIKSQSAFNQRLARSFLEPTGHSRINHHHALVDPFLLVMYRVASKHEAKLLLRINGHIHDSIPPPAPITAVFWSPKGNLIIRAKKAISNDLHTLLMKTVMLLCGGDNGFNILDRPALLLLKIKGVPTRNNHGNPLDPEQVLLELFDNLHLEKASFWHTLRFITYKGTPPGCFNMLLFSIVDSPDFASGKSLVDTMVSLFSHFFEIQ